MTPIKDLLSSKKFITTVVGVSVALAAWLGFDLDKEMCFGILAIFAMLVGAQGLADHGKEAEKEKAKAAAESAKSIAVFLLVGSLLAGASLSAGCGSKPGIVARAAAGDFYDCVRPEAKTVALELGAVMDRAVRSAINYDGTFDRAQLKDAAAPIKEPALRCAFVTALNTVGRIVGPSLVMSSPLAVDDAERAAAMREVAGLYGVAGFKLESSP